LNMEVPVWQNTLYKPTEFAGVKAPTARQGFPGDER